VGRGPRASGTERTRTRHGLRHAATAALIAVTATPPDPIGARVGITQPLLNAMFGDHAVLQRDQPIRLYGRAAPGDEVTLSLGEAGVTASGRADERGRWSATFPPQRAGGPYTLTARTAAAGAQTVTDVLVGDVFLCSGQSNIVLEVRRTLDSRAEIQNAANDRIRMLTVGLAANPTPLDTFAAPSAWQVAAPATVPEWSAACFYFARELQKTVHVPIGLVTASWGGSNIRAWMSEQAIRAVGGYDDGLDLLGRYARDPAASGRRWGEVWEAWWRGQASSGAAAEPWAVAPPREGEWRVAPESLGFWESWGVPDLANFNGMVWYRTSVHLSPQQAAHAATLSLGTIDEIDQTWLNGRPVGNTSGPGTRRNYPVAAGALRVGENIIVVNALDTYGTGGLYGPAERRALRLANGEVVPLTSWRYRVAASGIGTPPRAPWESTGGLTTIRNGMIAPIGPYTFRGVVWYQGESNTGEADSYERLLAGLMADWRHTFGAGLPFLIVQLANYGVPHTDPVESEWALLREAQRQAVLHDERAGLAITIDIGDRYDLHPANKQELGRRLARVARHVIYGEAIAPSGPVPLSARRAGADVMITFGDVERELVAYSAAGPIGFELCGRARASCRFVSARLDGTRIHLAAGRGEPARVRFCWADAPVCTLFDRAGLPAGPFEMPIQ
jgi:sialate O-acetylesterase